MYYTTKKNFVNTPCKYIGKIQKLFVVINIMYSITSYILLNGLKQQVYVVKVKFKVMLCIGLKCM